MVATYTVTVVSFGRATGEYLVVGNVTGLALTSGAGTLTVPGLAVVDSILYLEKENSSSSATNWIKATAHPTTNAIAIESLTQGVGGTAANPALDSATTITAYFAVVGH
jgi:hypothetical protein